MRVFFLIMALSCTARAQTVFDSEAWVPGKTGVGTDSPGARFEGRASSITQAAFQVSGVDLSPAFRAGADGTLGLSTASAARVTVSGSGDAGDLALELRGPELQSGASSYQMTFGYAGGALYRHAVQSGHGVAPSSSSLTFLVWTPEASSGQVATRKVLQLMAHSTGVLVNVLPPDSQPGLLTQLVVSNGSAAGWGTGTMHFKDEMSPSSALFKYDILRLGLDAEERAYADVASLRHVRFGYKGKGSRPQRGLLFEEAPDSVRHPGGAVSFDRRLFNAELAARELLRRLDELEGGAP